MTSWPPLPPVAPADYARFLDRDNDEPLLAWLLELRRRFRHVNTLALRGDDERADFPIDQLYVPLTVSWEEPGEDGRPTRRGRTDELELLVAARKRVLLLGTAGAGKSTFVQWLTWTLAERARNPLHARIGALIPLPLLLRDLPITDATDSWDALVDLAAAASRWPEGLRQRIDPMGRAGQLLVLVDGWEEVADTALRRGLRAALVEAMARYPRSSFLLTSRPRGTTEVPLALPGPGSAPVTARIEPLSPEARAALVLRWHRWRTPDDAPDLAASLLSAIDADPGLRYAATNPLLLTLLALVHQRFRFLPRRRSELFAAVVDAMLIDSIRDVDAALSRANHRVLLQDLALRMNRRRVWGASRADLAAAIPGLLDPTGQGEAIDQLQVGTTLPRPRAREILARCAAGLVPDGGPVADPDATAGQLLDRAVRRSGLLVPRDPDRIAFAHLVVQDWLAAGAFCDRLRAAWADRGRADRAAAELQRWIFRSAGGGTVAFVLDTLRDELPAVATRLGDELFAERAARRLEHLRLAEVYSDVWRFRGGEGERAWPEWIERDPARVLELPPGAALSAPPAEITALYLCHRPDIRTLAPLLGGPPPTDPTANRTLFLVDTDIDRIPHGLAWRVVDEHGVCYTPQGGLVRPPHTPG